MEKNTIILKGTEEYAHIINLLESKDTSQVTLGLQLAYGCAPNILKKLLFDMYGFFVSSNGIKDLYDGYKNTFEDLASYLYTNVSKNTVVTDEACYEHLVHIYDKFGYVLCNGAYTMILSESMHFLRDIKFLPSVECARYYKPVFGVMPALRLKVIKIATFVDRLSIFHKNIHLQLQNVGCTDTKVTIDTDKILQVVLPLCETYTNVDICCSLLVSTSLLPLPFSGKRMCGTPQADAV